jgi:hypothetical protein
MKRLPAAVRAEIRHAKRKWGGICTERLAELRKLISRYHVSVFLGDVTYIGTSWYVTHAGLLRIADRRGCSGIRTAVDHHLSDTATRRWVFKAIVYKAPGSKGFVGYGDADPSNVSALVRGAELRIAETRAVNRALRKAYGIGLCSMEELGWSPKVSESTPSDQKECTSTSTNGNHNNQPRLRDRLCLLVRKHQLDSALVKSYAADFCGTETLRGASRDLVEAFVNNLAEWAAKDRDGLICKLNSYSQVKEVTQ